MSASFDFAIAFVLHQEGGYTAGNHDDPGGETNFGITKRSYPQVNIAALTREAAITIYRRDFWEPLNLDLLPAGLAVMLFDGAVNQGPGSIKGFIRDLQGLLGIARDGAIGPQTANACRNIDPARLLRRLCVLRAIRYTQAANFKSYNATWFDRLFECFDYCEGLPT